MSDTPSSFPPLDAMLCFSLYSAAQAMNRVYQPLLEPLGLTYTQYVVLVALWQEDKRPVGRLGRQIGLESNTLTPLLKRMEQAGLVRRSRSAKDERQVIVSLTPQGHALREKAAHIPGCIFDATGLGREDIVRLRDDVIALRDQLNAAA